MPAPDQSSDIMQEVDPARFRISRFFVRLRKLSRAGYLERQLIALALGRAAIEDVFLRLVDPLDQLITVRHYGRESVADREFFRALLAEFNLRRPDNA